MRIHFFRWLSMINDISIKYRKKSLSYDDIPPAELDFLIALN